MRNWWIRFGCFLTGYNFSIVHNSSEVAAKAVKRYTAAMIIVCILWSFIGFTFTRRYLHGETWGAIAGAIVMMIIIVQIERQIILTVNPSRWLYFFRGVIAVLMAIIGAIIIDQVLFKDDIELQKINFIQNKINQALPPKTAELRSQLASLDTAINKKETERLQLIEDVNKEPVLKTTTSQSVPVTVKSSSTDSNGRTNTNEKVVNTVTTSVNNIPNPKQVLIAPLEKTIAELRIQQAQKDSMLLNIRPQLEKEISNKVGFLDELQIMYALIKDSGVAFTVWMIWFLFLFGIEMLVLISKTSDKRNDYDETVLHQMNVQMKKLQVLEKYAHSS